LIVPLNKKLRRLILSEQGLTLIEASMVLALAAIVTAGAMLYYQSARDNNSLLDAQSEFGAIQAIVHSIYSERTGYEGLATSVTQGSSGIPSNLRDAGGNPITPWGGAITISSPHPYSIYNIEFDSIPAGACVPLVAEAVGASLTDIVVNTHSVMSPISHNADVRSVTQYCHTADDNTVIWSLL